MNHREIIWLTKLLTCMLFFPLAASTATGKDLTHLKPSPPQPVASQELQTSIQRGVTYLLDHQREDGGWGGAQWTGGVDSDPIPGSFRSFDVAVTAMCLESLLGVPENAPDQARVQQATAKAYRFLIARTDQIRRAGPNDLPQVWAHCYCIQTFAAMKQMTQEPARLRELTDAIQQHSQRLDRWQSVHGGWFYYGSGMSKPISPSCSFVNAAVLVALARSRDAGVPSNQAMVDRALKATRLMRKPDGSFLYSMRIPTDKTRAMAPINRPAGSLGRSQACNIALWSWHDKQTTEKAMGDWLNRLVTRHGWLDMGRKRPIPHESHAAVAGYFYYFGMYYGALCIEAMPPTEQAFYQHHLARLLIERQEKDGSWFDYPLYSYHKPYGTAFALLSLQRCQVQPNTNSKASRTKPGYSSRTDN